MTIDHICKNKLCVNPAHLQQCSKLENYQRNEGINIRKKFCVNGHEMSVGNTFVSNKNIHIVFETLIARRA